MLTDLNENMKNTGNARIPRNKNIAPYRKRKKLRGTKGQGGGPKLKNFSRSPKNRENDVF